MHQPVPVVSGEPEPAERGAARRRSPANGIALCLSGGGYRAMLFHLGAVWYLNQCGYLGRLNRISSVSGGSILAAFLGLHWHVKRGVVTRFEEEIVGPIRRMASTTIDVGSIVGGILRGDPIGNRLIAAYDEHLYGGATLQDLPSRPRFVINATNVQSGALVRFSKPFIWDYRVGKIPNPRVRVAEAVAASSAFPPVLSPIRLRFPRRAFEPNTGDDLQFAPYTREVVLTDGGVYDNLGIETAWKRYRTILVSDAGGKMAPDPDPKSDWLRHSVRINAIIDNQVRSLRKQQVISSFVDGRRKGAYWGTRTDIANYRVADAFDAPYVKTIRLARIETRLERMSPGLQERLINWGFAVTDAAMRRHVDRRLERPASLPYPKAGFG